MNTQYPGDVRIPQDQPLTGYCDCGVPVLYGIAVTTKTGMSKRFHHDGGLCLQVEPVPKGKWSLRTDGLFTRKATGLPQYRPHVCKRQP